MQMDLEKEYEQLNRKIELLILAGSKKIVKEYKKALEELRNEVRGMYDKYKLSEDKLTLSEVAKYKRLLSLDKAIERIIHNLYQENSEITKETLKEVFTTSVERNVHVLEEETGRSLHHIKKVLNISDTVNERMAGLHWSERLGHHRDNVIYKIQKTLKEGLAQGSTYREMSDRLRDSLNGDVIQPMRIIRTEAGRVYARAQEETLDRISKNVPLLKKWHTSKDERVRGFKPGDKVDHMSMEGQTVPYEEDFVFPDGIKTKTPRLSGVASHDIHCRCWMSVELAEAQEGVVVNEVEPEYNEENEKRIFESPTDEQIQEYQNVSNDLYQLLKGVDIDAYNSLIDYTGGGYKRMNSYLKHSDPKMNPDVQNVDRAMQKFELKEDVIVYRGTKAKFFKGCKEGDVFDGKVFYSTSFDKGYAQAFYEDVRSYGEEAVMLEIRVPRGTKSIYIGENSAYEDEKELLLSYELKYKVIEMRNENIILEVLP